MKICINPGHGGYDSGAVGPNGERESDVNLSVATFLTKELRRRGYSCMQTRTDDSFMSLLKIANAANTYGADLFISIHANSGGGVGFEAFTSKGDTKADPAATNLLNSFYEMFSERIFRKDISDGDPDKEASFTVLTKTRMPAVLFELGFIDHFEECNWLTNGINQKNMAIALANGVERTFKVSMSGVVLPAATTLEWLEHMLNRGYTISRLSDDTPVVLSEGLIKGIDIRKKV